MLSGVMGRLNVVYAVGAGVALALLVLLIWAWRRRRKRRTVYLEMANYRNAICAQVSNLADGFDDLLEGAEASLANWAVSRGGVRRFLGTIKRVAAALSRLQEQVVEESVPKDLVATKGSMLRALNEVEKYIDSVLHAKTVEEALEIIGGTGLQDGLDSLQAMDEALDEYAKRYRIRTPS